MFDGQGADRHRLQTKEALRLAVHDHGREEVAAAMGITVHRLDHCIAETSNKNLFAFEVPSLTAATGSPALLEFLAAQTGHSVDEAAVVELGRVAVEIERLEKRRAELLGEVA